MLRCSTSQWGTKPHAAVRELRKGSYIHPGPRKQGTLLFSYPWSSFVPIEVSAQVNGAHDPWTLFSPRLRQPIRPFDFK